MAKRERKIQLLVIALIKGKLIFRIPDKRVFKIQYGQEEIAHPLI